MYTMNDYYKGMIEAAMNGDELAKEELIAEMNYTDELHNKIDKAINDIDKLEQDILNKTIISLNQFVPRLNDIKNYLKECDKNE